MLMTLPNEGQTVDWSTPAFHLANEAVHYMPLGILSVAKGIPPHHEVKILDASSLGLDINKTLEEIEIFEPHVLGISAVTRKAYALAQILQKANVPWKVVGGPHVTHYASETIAFGTDAVFRHDADYNFGRWLDDTTVGIFDDYIPDIDVLPFPKYELLNIQDYAISDKDAPATLLGQGGVRAPMFSSKGCPFKCVFCDVQNKRFRWLSGKQVVDEMEFLLSLGASSIHIIDDCFNIRHDRVLDICAEIKKRNLKFEWSARGRAEINSEVAQALSEAGCRRLHAGIESLDPNVLRWINKKLDVDTIKNFCELCREYNIQILGYFIVGTPLETREYREHLPEMIEELGITYPYFNQLYPASHTNYYESLLKDGTYKKDHWLDFTKNPTPNWEIPLPYSKELFLELQETINGYISIFYKEMDEMNNFLFPETRRWDEKSKKTVRMRDKGSYDGSPDILAFCKRHGLEYHKEVT